MRNKNKLIENELTVGARIPVAVKEKMTKRIIERSSETGKIYNVSTYLRELIEKDYEKHGK